MTDPPEKPVVVPGQFIPALSEALNNSEIEQESDLHVKALQEAIVKTESFFWDYVLKTEGRQPTKRQWKRHAQKFRTDGGVAYTWRGVTVCAISWEDGVLTLLQK